jgi:hypothetical protein
MGRPKGSPASSSQKAAGRANLAKGQAKRAESLRTKKEAQKRGDYVSAKDRWAMLLSGQLTMKDLNDEEIQRRQVADSLGVFTRGRAVPSHLISQFDAEHLTRLKDGIRKGATRAETVLYDMLDDPDVEPKDRINIAKYLLDRYMGKTPETVHIKSDDWAGVIGEAVEVERDLSDIEQYANEA